MLRDGFREKPEARLQAAVVDEGAGPRKRHRDAGARLHGKTALHAFARLEADETWRRGHFLRATRGARGVMLTAEGPGSMADLFGPLLADLAAQATPGG